MNLRISSVLIATLLAGFGLLTSDSKPDPVEAARLNNLGVAYMNQQLFEKGLKYFQQAAAADPKLAIARLNDGIAYLNLQKVDEAKAALEDALKQDPKSPNAWYSLGMLAKNTGDAPAAIDAFKHVIEIDANDADTWYFLGTAYVQAKQFPQAIDAFEHALKLNPLHASAEFGLSRAYQQSADVDHAREHLKKFQYITQNKIGAPMSLAYGEQGQYSRAVESPQSGAEGAGADQGAVCGCDEGSGDCSRKHNPAIKTEDDKRRGRRRRLFSRLRQRWQDRYLPRRQRTAGRHGPLSQLGQRQV